MNPMFFNENKKALRGFTSSIRNQRYHTDVDIISMDMTDQLIDIENTWKNDRMPVLKWQLYSNIPLR